MSKLLYICARHSLPSSTLDQLGRICTRLTPDHITAGSPRLSQSGTIAIAVVNPGGAMLGTDESILLGCLFGGSPDWSRPNSAIPDGSYALIRADNSSVEVVSDPAGSRTLWILQNEEYFVCSTSQRAILMFIGGFEFDERVVPWVLSTGTPGPTLSWDRRVKRLPPDSSLTLDRSTWTTRQRQNSARFVVQKRSREEHRAALSTAFEETFESTWSYQADSLIVPLSGGYDSRSILCLLRRSRSKVIPVETITWGLESRRDIIGADAQVAAEVATALGVPNRFIALDAEPVKPEQVLARFIGASEGRVDAIAGYVDGMNLWRYLHESGVEVILRGDEGFGWKPAATERAVRYDKGLALASDYPNLELLLRQFNIAPNELSGEYLRDSHESVATYRDRITLIYRIPTFQAGWSDLKLSYVELINPLLSRRILEQIRCLPDELRTDKILFKEIVNAISPPIPYATAPAIGLPGEVLARPDYLELMTRSLRDLDGAHSPLPAGMLTTIAAGMSRHSSGNSSTFASAGRRKLVRLLPHRLRNRIRDFKPNMLDRNLLGFRAFILTSILQLIADDGDSMRRARRREVAEPRV